MDTPLLDAVEINPVLPPRASIIWLHGLGADGHDFEPLIPQLDIVDTLGVRVVLPHAPRRPVTINGGMLMPAWYDIAAANFSRGQDSEGIRASEQQLRALIAREVEYAHPELEARAGRYIDHRRVEALPARAGGGRGRRGEGGRGAAGWDTLVGGGE